MAFDAGQSLTPARRQQLYTSVLNSDLWSYVEPKNLTPTWVHFDARRGNPACSTGGFPIIRSESRGSYVLIAQDCLNTLGYRTGGLDGVFGAQTLNAVKSYQRKEGLTVDGIVGCNTWRSLLEDVIGKGRTSTTID